MDARAWLWRESGNRIFFVWDLEKYRIKKWRTGCVRGEYISLYKYVSYYYFYSYYVMNLQNHTFLPIKSELMDGFWHSRCLNDHIDLPNIIRSLASGANASLVAKNWTKKTFQTLQFSITILCYLEAEIDYRPFILFCRVVFHNYAQEVSSQFD